MNANRKGFRIGTVIVMLIVLFGFFLRASQLDRKPVGLNSDELLKAFDGASVYHTGYDHHGDFLPVFFQQSGEYSPPIYIYFSGLFSYCFGINAYTVRLPSAILGALSIWIVYLLIREIHQPQTAIWAAGLVALSPWNIYFSRIGWEAILQVPLQLAALLFFFRWVRRKTIYELILSAIFFSSTLYAYPTERLFTPLFMLGIAALYRRDLWQHRMHVLAAFLAFLVLQIPYFLLMGTMYQAMQARWMFLSVFQRDDGISLFLQHYVLHLSPVFMFWNGLHEVGGLALLVAAPFFYFGIYFMIRENKREYWVFLWWLLIFAIPSSMTYDRYDINSMPNALRTTCGIGLIEIIAAIGLYQIMELYRKASGRINRIAGIAVAVNFTFVFLLYARHFQPIQITPDKNPFQYGLREAVEYLEEHKGDFDRIIVSHKVRLHPISLATFSGMQPRPFSAKDFPKYIIPFYHYLPIYWEFGHREYERLGTIDRWYYQGTGKRMLLTLGNELRDETPVWEFKNPSGHPIYKIFAVNK